jgi:hypothetical protein
MHHKNNIIMETQIEILKKLGFSEQLIKVISEYPVTPDLPNATNDFLNFENITGITSEVTLTVIKKSEKPVNSYYNFQEK